MSCVSLPQGKPYDGFQKKLVIAFDIGTSFSGVSYVFLIPHGTPVIHGVTQFPGQTFGGDSKIPSVVCYDRDGNVVAVGSETSVETNPKLREIQGLVRAEWFKLYLRPTRQQGFDELKDVPVLPRNKSVIDIFSDLLGYMYKSTKQYIRERQGDDMLRSVGNNIEFILSHPNGWEGQQQPEMCRAAINAGLVNANDALEQISFVTEGEASLHFCLNKIPDTFEKYANDGILVADCGGGTVDISSYARSKSMTCSRAASGSDSFKEIAPAMCLLQGSCFVTRRAQIFLAEKLRGSKFGTKRDIEFMTRYFDRTTKPRFKEPSGSYFIPSGRNENDPEQDIRSGSIKLNGIDIARFFEPAVKNIIEAIEEQTRKTTPKIRAIFLVGGFATSDYLFSKLEDHFKVRGIDILRPGAYLGKAVAEGAIILKINPFVSCEAEHRLTKLQDEFDQLQEKYSRESRAAQAELQALRDELRVLRNESQVLLRQRYELAKLADTQAAELTAVREFTFMIDQVSAADVSRTIQDLNSTIYQTAMQLISIEQPAPPTAPSTSAADTEDLNVEARNYSIKVIGERLLHLAQSVGKDDESFLILAFQSAIVHVCFSAISSWVSGHGCESRDKILYLAYKQIWASEKQAVAGRWRALTHKQVSSMSGDKVQREIHTILLYLLISIGWKAEPRQIQALLEEKLSECVNEIATFVAKTSKMIHEEFVSDDLQVTYVRPGKYFNPLLMDGADGQAPEVQAPVLGTVELGLALRNRAGGQQTLLKPMVALDTSSLLPPKPYRVVITI